MAAICWMLIAISIPEGAIKSLAPPQVQLPNEEFQYPKVQLKAPPSSASKKPSKNISIPEGAIKSANSRKTVFDTAKFQYPKVQLKVKSPALAGRA